MTTRRIQCGGASLEIDPLTGELTFEDFLSVPPDPHMYSMPTPKVELGPTFSMFGIPAIDGVFEQILDKLELFRRNADAFTDYLNKLFKNAINWTLILAGVTTVSVLIPILVREITNLILRWKKFHEWEKENAEGVRPEQIPPAENDEEITEMSGEDLEPPSIGEYEVPKLDEHGHPMFDMAGRPIMETVQVPLDRDASDYYDPIPDPDDLTEDEVTPEADELEEDRELITVDNALIRDILNEFDPQVSANEENYEFLLDSGVYILHIKNVFLLRECISGGVRGGILNGCGMIMDKIVPALSERYGHEFTVRVPNCSTYPDACCRCHFVNGLSGSNWKVRVVPDDMPIWHGCECTCGANCGCPCHVPGENAVREVTHTCKRRKFQSNFNMHLGLMSQPPYFSDCWNYPSISTDDPNKPFSPGELYPPAHKIIRRESETRNFPYNSMEACDFCKVMYKYYTTTCDFKLHKSETDVYIFFSRGKQSTLFGEPGKPIIEGPATNAVYDYLTSRKDLFEFNQVKCRCDVQRPICTAIFRGFASDVHVNTTGYTSGHAQTVKYLYLPDFDPLQCGDPWWYDDPHDYQSVKKRCIFEGMLEHKVPAHVFRFYTYRRLADKNWFPRLFKQICDELNKDYPDIPSGADEFKPLRTRLAWQAINRMLSDVVPVEEIYPELAAPERPLFAERPEGWAALEGYGSDWSYLSLDAPGELAPVARYLALLDKYYPGWKAFRDAHEAGWWGGFWRQIPDIAGLERTTVFLEADTHVEGDEIVGEPPWWRAFWGPTIRDNMPDPDRPKTRTEVLAVMEKY